MRGDCAVTYTADADQSQRPALNPSVEGAGSHIDLHGQGVSRPSVHGHTAGSYPSTGTMAATVGTWAVERRSKRKTQIHR